LTEVAFLSTNLFFLKFYSPQSYEAMTFFTILLPFMIYAIATLFGSLLKFIKLLHIEEQAEDDGSFLTLK
jgi:hypothetical protein